ncbi:MAG: hypothetical protein WCP30_13795, partial [Mycobacteriaceae bacterium]
GASAPDRRDAPRVTVPDALPRECRAVEAPESEEEVEEEPAEASDPVDGPSAQATAEPLNAPAPTPRATANPPTRPTNLLAFIAEPSLGRS